MVEDSYCPKQRDGLLSEEVDGETVILDVDGKQVHQLNATAHYIWQRCDGATSVAQLCESVAAAFDVDAETASKDIRMIIAQLSQLQLLSPG